MCDTTRVSPQTDRQDSRDARWPCTLRWSQLRASSSACHFCGADVSHGILVARTAWLHQAVGSVTSIVCPAGGTSFNNPSREPLGASLTSLPACASAKGTGKIQNVSQAAASSSRPLSPIPQVPPMSVSGCLLYFPQYFPAHCTSVGNPLCLAEKHVEDESSEGAK